MPRLERPSVAPVPPVNLPQLNNPIVPPGLETDIEIPQKPQLRNPIFLPDGEAIPSVVPSISVPKPLQSLPSQPSTDWEASDSLEGLADFDYWANLCHLLADQQEYGKALSACNQAIKLKPKAVEIWVERTRILFAMEQYTETLRPALVPFLPKPQTIT